MPTKLVLLQTMTIRVLQAAHQWTKTDGAVGAALVFTLLGVAALALVFTLLGVAALAIALAAFALGDALATALATVPGRMNQLLFYSSLAACAAAAVVGLVFGHPLAITPFAIDLSIFLCAGVKRAMAES